LRDSRFPNPAKPDIGSNDKNHEISATPVVIVAEFAIDALEKCETAGFSKILWTLKRLFCSSLACQAVALAKAGHSSLL